MPLSDFSMSTLPEITGPVSAHLAARSRAAIASAVSAAQAVYRTPLGSMLLALNGWLKSANAPGRRVSPVRVPKKSAPRSKLFKLVSARQRGGHTSTCVTE
jgi:hypothetical protein